MRSLSHAKPAGTITYDTCTSLLPVDSVNIVRLFGLANPNSRRISLTSVTYEQDFDFLSDSATPIAWTNFQGTETTSGSPGWFWYSSFSSYNVDNGDSIGGRFSYGVGSDDDRAMGSVTTAADPEIVAGLVLRNALSDTIFGFNITFTGEKWRDGNAASDSISFAYKTSSTNFTIHDFEETSVLPSGWTPVAALSFTTTDAVDVGALNGNDPANRTTLTASILVTVPVGHYIALRWYDDEVTGSDHGMAIDDLTITAAVPEPSAAIYGSVIGALAVFAAIVRRFVASLTLSCFWLEDATSQRPLLADASPFTLLRQSPQSVFSLRWLKPTGM